MNERRIQVEAPVINDINEVQAAIDEPQAKHAIAEARALNNMLRLADCPQSDVLPLVRELDQTWGVFMGQEIEVTGAVTVYSTYAPRAGGFVVDLTVEGAASYNRTESAETMRTKGFIIEIDENNQRTIRLAAERSGPFVIGDTLVESSQLVGIDIDHARVDFTDIVSDNRARKWLEVYASSFIDEVDEVLFDESLQDSADAIMALKCVRLDIMANHVDPGELGRCLSAYIDSVVEIDKHTPYIIGFEGPAIIPSPDGLRLSELSSDIALATINKIIPHKIFDYSNDTSYWRLFLDCVIHHPEQGESSVQVSLDALEYCNSLRTVMYGNSEQSTS